MIACFCNENTIDERRNHQNLLMLVEEKYHSYEEQEQEEDDIGISSPPTKNKAVILLPPPGILHRSLSLDSDSTSSSSFLIDDASSLVVDYAAGDGLDDTMMNHDESCNFVGMVLMWLHSWYLFFKRTLLTQLNALFQDFSSNGLPWNGPKCRSLMAGGSGILFIMPAFVCKNHPIDQSIWIIQAILSVWADYFHVDRPSIAHGLDRISAQLVFWSMVFRSATELQWWACLFGFIPTICFCGANHAKRTLNLDAWHYWHFAWHLTGGLGVTMIVYLMHHCPVQEVSSPLLQGLCKV